MLCVCVCRREGGKVGKGGMSRGSGMQSSSQGRIRNEEPAWANEQR